MDTFIVRVHKWKNTNYEIGRKQMQSIQEKPSYVSLLQSLTSDLVDFEKGTSLFREYAPHLLAEIQGLGDELGISYQEAFRYFSGYDMPKLGALGCSSIVTPHIFIRNYDFSPDVYDHKFTVKNSPDAYATCGHSLHGTGLHEGVNEHGLAVALHFVNNQNQQQGFMSPIIVRMVLDTCKSLEEAVDFFKAMPHAACYNFSVGDSKGDVAVVEGSPEGVVVRRGEEAMTCTNHFEDMAQFNREHAMNSKRRKEVLAGSLDSSEDLFDTFATPGDGLFYQNYKEFFGTLHTFSYDFSKRKVKTKVAQSPDTLEFELDDLTNDRDLPVSCLKGYIEDID